MTNRNLWNIKSIDYDSLYSKYTSIKKVVLFLHSEGYNRTEIGSFLGKSSQHIGNILNEKNSKKSFDIEHAKYQKNKK